MEELLHQLISKVGLDAKQAEQVIGVVTGFLKDKVPADMLNQLSGLVGGLGDVAGDAAGAAKDVAGAAAGAAKDVAGAADDVASAAGDKAEDAAGGIMAKLGGLFGGDSK
jgi:hypothetical protein